MLKNLFICDNSRELSTRRYGSGIGISFLSFIFDIFYKKIIVIHIQVMCIWWRECENARWHIARTLNFFFPPENGVREIQGEVKNHMIL